MTLCPSFVAFALVSGLCATHATAQLPVEVVEPYVIRVPEAVHGPPALTCDEALATYEQTIRERDVGSESPQAAVRDTPPTHRTSPTKEPEPVGGAEIIIDRRGRTVGELPGGRPDKLPLRPLEGHPSALARIGDVMRKARRGERVRLTFFGASHTGGDHFTGRIRRTLQDRHGDLGHGFIMPAALYKGYRGSDINLCRTSGWRPDWVGKRDGRDDGLYGFAGASVSTDDPTEFSWIETTKTNAHGRSISRADIFTLGQPGGGSLYVQIDDTEPRIIHTHAPIPVLVHHRFVFPEGPHRVAMWAKGNGEVRVLGVSAERDGPGVLVDAIGIRGRTAKTWLEWDELMANQGMAALQPDLVVLAYGTNEANARRYTMDAYRRDLRRVLVRLRRALPDAPCLLVGPSDRGVDVGRRRFRIWNRTAPVAQVQRQVAPEFGCAFWDWQQATGGAGSMIAWRHVRPILAAKDLIHFTREGYERVGDLLLQALEHAERTTSGRPAMTVKGGDAVAAPR